MYLYEALTLLSWWAVFTVVSLHCWLLATRHQVREARRARVSAPPESGTACYTARNKSCCCRPTTPQPYCAVSAILAPYRLKRSFPTSVEPIFSSGTCKIPPFPSRLHTPNFDPHPSLGSDDEGNGRLPPTTSSAYRMSRARTTNPSGFAGYPGLKGAMLGVGLGADVAAVLLLSIALPGEKLSMNATPAMIVTQRTSVVDDEEDSADDGVSKASTHKFNLQVARSHPARAATFPRATVSASNKQTTPTPSSDRARTTRAMRCTGVVIGSTCISLPLSSIISKGGCGCETVCLATARLACCERLSLSKLAGLSDTELLRDTQCLTDLRKSESLYLLIRVRDKGTRTRGRSGVQPDHGGLNKGRPLGSTVEIGGRTRCCAL